MHAPLGSGVYVPLLSSTGDALAHAAVRQEASADTVVEETDLSLKASRSDAARSIHCQWFFVTANDRSIIRLVMVGHALVHTYELSIPIFMTVWLSAFGVAEATLGGVVGAGYVLFGVGALPGGLLADRFGARTLITACLAGMGLSFVGLGLASGLWTVGTALLLWGTAASVYHPAALSLISTGVQQRGRGLAWHGIAGNVGIAGGPLVTALLLLVVDWQTVAFLLRRNSGCGGTGGGHGARLGGPDWATRPRTAVDAAVYPGVHGRFRGGGPLGALLSGCVDLSAGSADAPHSRVGPAH